MRNALAIARKELGIYFTTPWAYVVFTAMLAISSFFFVALLQDFRQAHALARMYGWERLGPSFAPFKNLTDGVVVNLWNTTAVITLFVAPFLTMRLFAEERRNRTLELLMTLPVKPREIVLGKFLGGVGISTAALGVTIVFPLTLALFGASESGQALEWNTVLLGFGALLLWGATCISIGMFISALTESQMLAAILTFAVALVWWLFQGLAQGADEPWRSIGAHLGFSTQLAPLLRGLVDLKSLVFFASAILFMLLLTDRAVEAQRWT
ncbi:MAG TPA: ABC transporter permease [Myxococcaceae bacterium]|nr:ABC transporter permease [Myxococcaceae bacterium]